MKNNIISLKKYSKIIKVGDSFYYPIPKAFIDNKLISLNKLYRIELMESE